MQIKKYSIIFVFVCLLTGCLSDTYDIVDNDTEYSIKYGNEETITNDLDDTEEIEALLEEIDVDYIFVTDRSHSEVPQKLQVGDTFLGMTLEEIYFSRVFIKDGEYYRHGDVAARFSGAIVVNGNFNIYGDSMTDVRDVFYVDELCADKFPWLLGNEPHILRFEIRNYSKIYDFVGLSEEIVDTGREVYKFKNVELKIDNFILIHFSSNVPNSAEVVDIISIEKSTFDQ